MKNSYRHVISGLLLITGVLFNSGCSLTETIYDTPVPNQVLRDEADVPVVLFGLYGTLKESYPGNNYTPLWMGLEMILDIASTSAEGTYKYDGTSNNIRTMYSKAYEVINNANSLLESLDNITFQNTANAARYRGEIHFLKSLAYFNLVRMFGKVPVVSQSTTSQSNFALPRSSVEEVYAQVFDGFKKAAAGCPGVKVMPVAERGRVTRGAAHSLLAEAYLTYANYLDLNNQSAQSPPYYTLARSYADSVIVSGDYKLVAKYNDLFDNLKENDAYQEVIFGIQFTADATAGSIGSSGSNISTWFSLQNRFKVCGLAPDGIGYGSYGIAPWVYDRCTSGDYADKNGNVDFRMGNLMVPTRYKNDVASRTAGVDVECTTYPQVRNSASDVNPFKSFTCCTKWVDSRGITGENNGNDIFYIRYADILLIKAEAANELEGPSEAAIAAFNQVRARARASGNGQIPANLTIAQAATKEDFRMKIYDERVIELYAEGKNYFDVRRMRYRDNKRTMIQYVFEDVYPQLLKAGGNKSLQYNPGTNAWEGARLNINQAPAWNVKWILYPIPATEYQLNPALKGDYNPGWN